MKNKTKKIIYYNDPINDDFAKNITNKYQIKDNFKYIKKNIFFRFFSYLLYHFIAIPIFYCILKIKYHARVIGKKNIKPILKTGFFIYGNHSQNIIDALWPQALLVPSKNSKIISSNDVYSLKGLNTLVNMLGCYPTPNNMIQSKKFFDGVKHYINKNNVFILFPEAHIWPYYNDVRPFLDNGFIFPATFNRPVIAATLVYRERKICKNRKPFIDIYVSKPIFPLPNFSINENKKYLRDKVYQEMKKTIKEHPSFEFIHYEKKH